MSSWAARLRRGGRRDTDAGRGRPGAGPSPVTITAGAGPPGPQIPDDFAGLSFEVGPLVPGNAGVRGYLFSPENGSLVTLARNLGLRNLRIGGGSVDQRIPAGTGRDGFTGVDNLFAFAAAAGVKIIYTLRLLNPVTAPVPDLKSADAGAAGHIWGRYREPWPASRSGTSRTGTRSTATTAIRSTRRSARRSRGCRAARTRPTWPAGTTSPARSRRRRPGPRWPARTPGPTAR